MGWNTKSQKSRKAPRRPQKKSECQAALGRSYQASGEEASLSRPVNSTGQEALLIVHLVEVYCAFFLALEEWLGSVGLLSPSRRHFSGAHTQFQVHSE